MEIARHFPSKNYRQDLFDNGHWSDITVVLISEEDPEIRVTKRLHKAYIGAIWYFNQQISGQFLENGKNELEIVVPHIETTIELIKKYYHIEPKINDNNILQYVKCCFFLQVPFEVKYLKGLIILKNHPNFNEIKEVSEIIGGKFGDHLLVKNIPNDYDFSIHSLDRLKDLRKASLISPYCFFQHIGGKELHRSINSEKNTSSKYDKFLKGVKSINFSPDCKMVATFSSDNNLINIFDSDTLELLHSDIEAMFFDMKFFDNNKAILYRFDKYSIFSLDFDSFHMNKFSADNGKTIGNFNIMENGKAIAVYESDRYRSIIKIYTKNGQSYNHTKTISEEDLDNIKPNSAFLSFLCNKLFILSGGLFVVCDQGDDTIKIIEKRKEVNIPGYGSRIFSSKNSNRYFLVHSSTFIPGTTIYDIRDPKKGDKFKFDLLTASFSDDGKYFIVLDTSFRILVSELIDNSGLVFRETHPFDPIIPRSIEVYFKFCPSNVTIRIDDAIERKIDKYSDEDEVEFDEI